jgi:hypothetical protein
MSVLVINDATRACCGQSANNCRCGREDKPTPLGLPVWNWEKANGEVVSSPRASTHSVVANSDAPPTPMVGPHTQWKFEKLKK